MRTFIVVLVLFVAACSQDSGDKDDNADENLRANNSLDAGPNADRGGSVGQDTDDINENNMADASTGPPTDPNWQQSYVDGSGRFSCDDDLATIAGGEVASLTAGDVVIFAGYEQIGDNQNPLVARFDGATQTYCARHETQGPDGRAWGLTWDGGDHLYVVYTIVGGGSDLEGKGWLESYAPGAISGGGPRVSYVGRVRADDGALEAGTFVIAVKSDNKVNSHSPSGPPRVLDSGDVEFVGSSAHKPIDADGRSAMDCTDYPFESRYVFAADLQQLICADCTNCNAQQPCP